MYATLHFIVPLLCYLPGFSLTFCRVSRTAAAVQAGLASVFVDWFCRILFIRLASIHRHMAVLCPYGCDSDIGKSRVYRAVRFLCA